ncbi:helix-turn-helix domain-containing protein [Streptomyces lavendulae]|uniref:helix-turn-helix domain-containing protein n=1 Tax=Streptomyces lavendulae TaxID=1914 RepID=UPI0036939ECF
MWKIATPTVSDMRCQEAPEGDREAIMAAAKRPTATHGPRPKATTQQVAEYLQVDVETLYKWRHSGVGPPGVRVGKYLRYDWSDVEAWWNEQKAAA